MTPIQPNTRTEAQRTTAARLPPHLKRLVLTGFMGAGKSTIGRLLASHIGWSFLDLDAHLEQRTGVTIPQLFERHGEARFRRLESTALASALSRAHIVLALGGGTPEEIANQALLQVNPGVFTIFLDAPFPTLFDRCVLQDLGNPNARPVLTDPAEAQLRFARRHPLYQRLAGLTVQTAGLTPGDTVQSILTALNQISHSRT